MGVLFANSAKSKLAANLSSGATLLAIDEDDAWKFPSPAGGDWFPLTLFDAAGNIEYVKCTGRAAAILTIVRAQEGTTAKTFPAGSGVSHRLTAAALQAMRDTQSTALDDAVSALEDSISGAVSTLTSRIDSVVGTPPNDLNSLQKIAAAIGDDADFATTMASQIADAARLTTGTVADARLPARLQSGSSLSIANQAEAEAGADNTKVMTALRVKQAIEALGGTAPNRVVFAASGTYTPPANLKWAKILVIGGGGGWGNYNSTNIAGAGGGASEKIVAANQFAASNAVVVGAGGSLNTNGGASSIALTSSTISATGGGSGYSAGGFSTGGRGSNGDHNYSGNNGGATTAAGWSIWDVINPLATADWGYGHGGTSSVAAKAGVVIIEEYF